MRLKSILVFIATILLVILSGSCYHNFLDQKIVISPATFRYQFRNYHPLNSYVDEEQELEHPTPRILTSKDSSTESVLLPDWEVLTIASPDNPLSSSDQYSCLFQNNATSPAKFNGVLGFSNRTTFKCIVPHSVRSLKPLFKPILNNTQETWPLEGLGSREELFQWNFMAYESTSTEKDVLLFVKGVNKGLRYRSPTDLKCVLNNDRNNSVKTEVTSSSQEVFRCNHPSQVELQTLVADGHKNIKISLEVDGKIVPSVTYYEPKLKVEQEEGKSLLCASTMVYNVGKFLKEWVVYHSNLGVKKFVVYDNDSDDNLQKVVQELLQQNYIVETIFWPWPKSQESAFSHSAIYAKDSCTWMMYMDVDEFVYSPLWATASQPSRDMISSLLPTGSQSSKDPIGQLSINCLEFGPSNQTTHPVSGVTQGYTCRRTFHNHHKSFLLLDAVDDSLQNVIHHFKLKDGYISTTLSMKQGVVNHYKYQAWSEYKYQAWSEFKAKFRRRASANVADWKEKANPNSRDRAPGLGYEAIEPKDWTNRFCEMNDTRLKDTTRKWFSLNSPAGSKMAWQS